MEDYDEEDDMDEYQRHEEEEEEQMDIDETNEMFPGMFRFGKSRSTPFASNKEETKEQTKRPRTYLDRCKEVGRVGPKVTKLEPTSAMGTVKILDETANCCDVEGVS